MGFLQCIRALIVGLANHHSIAWGVALALRREGTELAFIYPGDKLADNVMGLAKASLGTYVCNMAAALGPKQIRLNAISAGPSKTAVAKGISDSGKMLDYCAHNDLLDEVGNAAAFLCADLAPGISGDVLYVDTGYHIQGTHNSEWAQAAVFSCSSPSSPSSRAMITAPQESL